MNPAPKSSAKTRKMSAESVCILVQRLTTTFHCKFTHVDFHFHLHFDEFGFSIASMKGTGGASASPKPWPRSEIDGSRDGAPTYFEVPLSSTK